MTHTTESLSHMQMLFYQSGGLIEVHPIVQNYADQVKFYKLPLYSNFQTQLSTGKMLSDEDLTILSLSGLRGQPGWLGRHIWQLLSTRRQLREKSNKINIKHLNLTK